MVFTKKLYRMILCLSSVLWLLAQIGCATLTENQRKNAADFSKATTALAEVTLNEFVQMRDGTILMNTYRLAAVGEEEGQAGLDNLDEAFDVEDVKIRIQAVEVLKTYGELLQALVDETQEKGLRNASDKFVASIHGLPSGDKKMSDKQADALGEVVYQIGRFVVEAKKAKAVREVVTNTKGQIDHLCDLLSNEFKEEGVRLLMQYKKSGDVAIAAIQDSFLNTKPDDVITRLRLVEMYKQTQANRDRVAPVAKNVSIAIGNMKKANDALYKSMENLELTPDDFKNLKGYRDSVKMIIDAIKVLGQE